MAGRDSPPISTQLLKEYKSMERFSIISGCSGGGKSSLLSELARRGFATIEEPGRRIVRSETESGGTALPWLDLEAFLRAALALSLTDLEAAATSEGRVFFDRGLFDAASGLEALTGEPWLDRLRVREKFGRRVFITPPWPEIYVGDGERRHGMDQAIIEYERLVRDYPAHGFEIIEVPRMSIMERADFVLGY